MPFTIVRQDITHMQVDAIVNAANTELLMGGGVCGAIFNAAGAAQLQAACDKLSPIETGKAAVTPGFNLPAKFIIHAAGPVYSRWHKKKSEELLRSAYTESLKLALENNCESIAFPLISSGIYGYPKDEALKVAVSAIKDFLNDHDMDVYLAVFDKSSFNVSKKLLGDVKSYIDQKYADTHHQERRRLLDTESKAIYREQNRQMFSGVMPAAAPKRLDDMLMEMDVPFNITLLSLIDQKGKTDAEVYKKANISRKLFSKIRTGNGYMPSKRTILALAIALELSLRETDDLLERAGYALSNSQKFDIIVEYFIINKIYDIFEINQVLFTYDQPLLGGN